MSLNPPGLKKRVNRDDAYVVKLNDVLGREIRRAFGEFLEQWRQGKDDQERSQDGLNPVLAIEEKNKGRHRKQKAPSAS